MLLCYAKASCTRILQKAVINNVSNAVGQRCLNISCQVEQLSSRGLVRVSGDEVVSFLQGIVTNDLRHFQEGCKSLFTMFLNTKGRVLYDSIIYRANGENTFYIECDYEGLEDVIKHMKMYRVRRKIDIESISDELKLWVLFNPKEVETKKNDIKNVKQEQVVPCTSPNFEHDKQHSYFNDIILSNTISVYSDPRLTSLGNRVIAPTNEDVVNSVKQAGIQVETLSPWSYRMFRYRLGVGEGITELPVGKCFPLEANCDYLHGISFHKGCYIGQELTARTHHTGVVRKRLMPLKLHSEVKVDEFPIDTHIEAAGEHNKPAIGKLRGIEKNSGLGLLRIAEALEANKFKIKNIEGETLKPFWWPQELPKERLDSGSGKRS